MIYTSFQNNAIQLSLGFCEESLRGLVVMFKVSWASVSMGSTPMDSANLRKKIENKS